MTLRVMRWALLVAVAAGQVQAKTPTPDEAYQRARNELYELKRDDSRRRFRHHWVAVTRRLKAVATQHPASERAPEALALVVIAAVELTKWSSNSSDAQAAESALRELAEGWPRHRLTDDAALSVARVLRARGQRAGALGAASLGLAAAGDKQADLKALVASLEEVSTPAASPSKGSQVAAGSAAGANGPKAELKAKSKSKSKAPGGAPAEKVADDRVGGVHPTPPVSAALAEALRRAARVASAVHFDAVAVASEAQGRRVPPPRPTRERPPKSEDVEDGAGSLVSDLQESLRDVRVGEESEKAAANESLRSVARAEGNGELTLAQQLGLKVRRVVLDAGHGGTDTGAIGARGTREKDVTLAIAKKLARRLEEMGLEVVLTRSDDTFVALEERTRLANREHGDLFISIHCNAAPSRALRGVETYTLNTSSNRYSIRLAARENATSERRVGDLQLILADLATKANTGESMRLARRVQSELVQDLSSKFKDVRDLGTKEALFFVLLGAKMPAILVETAFLSNPDEELRLGSDDYQTQVAGAISQAVAGFLDERERQLAALE